MDDITGGSGQDSMNGSGDNDTVRAQDDEADLSI